MGLFNTINAFLNKALDWVRKMIENDDKATPSNGDGSRKLNKIIGYVATFCVTLVFSLAASMYNDLKTRTNTLEERVSYLYTDKVSRSELNEAIQQLRMQNEANKADIINQQRLLRDDILGRISILMNIMEKTK